MAQALVRRYGCSRRRARPERRDARHALGPGWQRDPALARRVSARRAARPSGCRSRDGEFDHLTFTYLLRYVDDPAATLRELARVVRPGGRIASLEFARAAVRPLWRALWTLYTRVGLPALGRLVSQRVARDRPLPRPAASPSSTSAIRSSRSREFWSEAGIGSVQVRPHEPRRRRRDVGHASRRPRRVRLSAPRSTRCARAAGAISSRCCTRRTPPGTSATSRSARPRRRAHGDRLRRRCARSSSPSGCSAHALDELNGRPLRHPAVRPHADRAGRRGARRRGRDRHRRRRRSCRCGLAPFVVAGAFIVAAYNLELFGGRFHTDFWFAAAWGAFPALTGYWANALALRRRGRCW